MAWNGYDEWEKRRQASGQFWNDWDLAAAQNDQNFANEVYKAKEGYALAQNDYNNAATPEARALAQQAMTGWNNYAENYRKNYNYTSGAQGAGYNPFGANTLSPATGGGYWGNEVKSNYQSYKSRDPFQYDPYTPGEFSYDYKTDPLYGVYKKEYTREGQRAMQDALASAATMTGGVPSSYAQTAAQQANNYYASKIADAIPQLRQQAYSEFADAENRRRNAWLDNLGLAQYQYESAGDQLMNAYQMAQENYGIDLDNARDAASLRAKYGDLGGYTDLYGIDNLQSLADESNAVYAFSDDGGDPYKISSATGLAYLNSLMPGQSVTGGDGSVWSMDELGNITITRDGRTWSIKSGKTGGRGGGGKVEDTTPFSDATWKQIAQAAAESPSTAAALLQQYWSKLTDSQKNILARNAGVSAEDLKAMGGIGAYGKNDFATWASFLPAPAATGDIYQQMYNAGITTEAEAKRWLQQNGYDKYTEANDAAKTYASLFGSGSFGNATPSNLVTNITSEVKDHKSAVNYLQNNGITATPLTQEQWAMSSDKSKFATYKDYLQSFAYEYMNG